MQKKARIACVIPARLASSRLAHKILRPIGGIPLLQRVWHAAKNILLFDEVVCAIDDVQTAQLVESFQGSYVMTSKECQNGTERVIEVVTRNLIQADIIINWQADSPFITQEMIENLLQTCDTNDADIWTLKKRITHPEEVHQSHVAKVVSDEQQHALYFSRSPIPYYRDENIPFEQQIYYKHIGIYAFTSQALKKIATLPSSYLEVSESLEQLRWLSNGLKIKVHETHQEQFEINVPEDMILAEKYVQQSKL